MQKNRHSNICSINPTEKCGNTVEKQCIILHYYPLFSIPKCVKYSRNFQNKMYEFYKIPKCVIKSVYIVYILPLKYTTQTLLQLPPNKSYPHYQQSYPQLFQVIHIVIHNSLLIHQDYPHLHLFHVKHSPPLNASFQHLHH